MAKQPFFLAHLSGRRIFLGVVTPMLLLLAGCAAVAPRPSVDQNIFVLHGAFIRLQMPVSNPGSNSGDGRPTIIVTPPRAVPGFDTRRIAYVPQLNEISYYANSRWADTPSRMLEPLLMEALEATGSFHAVAQSASPVLGDLRLDTEVIHLQQEFLSKPSRLRFTLRAQVLDLKRRQVLATRTFESVEEAPSDNAYGGVTAANRAIGKVLSQVAALAAEQAPSVDQKRAASGENRGD